MITISFNINSTNIFIRLVQGKVQHYNHEMYWSMRKEIVDNNSRLPKLIRLFYLYKIKKTDAFNKASLGTYLGSGAKFAEPPHFPHGLNGIIVGSNAIIGKNCIIYHQTTITGEFGGQLEIGDNCEIGSGARIIGNIKIGNNVKVGANCVVVKDLPDNCTAVGVPARIVKQKI